MMEKESLESLQKWFDGYVRSFRLDDRDWQANIDIKIDHSRKVRQACREIGQSIPLDEGGLRLAEAAGLFHDVGRFEQFRQYKTFSDHRSVNHAELGVRILAEKGVLDSESRQVRRILLRCVENHSKLEIPGDDPEDVRLYSRLVRDADKLDIWRVVSVHYCSENGIGDGVNQDLPDTPGVSQSVVDSLMKCRLVRMDELKNVNDFKLLQISWVYDVNFSKTLDLARRRGYLERIRNSIRAGGDVSAVYDGVRDHIDRRLAEHEAGGKVPGTSGE